MVINVRQHIDFIAGIIDAGITADNVKEVRLYIADNVEADFEDKVSEILYELLNDLSYTDLVNPHRGSALYKIERERAEVEMRDAIKKLEACDVARRQID